MKVTGYRLYIDDGRSGDFNVVYDGSKLPFTLQHTVEGLLTGLPYRFKVKAENINGFSDDSTVSTIYACLVPSNMLQPFKVATTRSSITIGWNEPDHNGCPIQGFSIFRDTGNNDALTVEVDSEIVNNKPSLRQYMITAGLTQVGHTYRFKVRAYNNAGFSESVTVLNVVLSDEPDTPETGPISDASVTNETLIKVNFGPVPVENNGGSPILSYELQIDDG